MKDFLLHLIYSTFGYVSLLLYRKEINSIQFRPRVWLRDRAVPSLSSVRCKFCDSALNKPCPLLSLSHSPFYSMRYRLLDTVSSLCLFHGALSPSDMKLGWTVRPKQFFLLDSVLFWGQTKLRNDARNVYFVYKVNFCSVINYRVMYSCPCALTESHTIKAYWGVEV
jgi:hypothetical protein